MATFRLDRQPWIPVVRTDGVATEANLIDVFRNAQQFSRISGSPLETVALTRFLLAIAYLTNTPTSLASWAQIWRQRGQFMQDCADYVTAQGDAWDLFDERHPFGQVTGTAGTRNPAHLLVYSAARKNNALFLDQHVADSTRAVDSATLARGIIVTNTYAGSSGGGYLCGPLAMRCVALLAGQTLDETLLLNLTVQPSAPMPLDWTSYGRPVDGPLDIARRYVWASRRVRLLSQSEMLLAPGDKMPDVELAEDPMVVMRKDAKGEAFVPLRLEAGRALWRSAHLLLCWRQDTRRLAAVDQLHRLVGRDHLPADQTMSVRACGVAGEAQGPATELWRDESLPFGLSVVADDARYATLVRAVNIAETTAQGTRGRIYSFAARYLQHGSDLSPDKSDIRRLADQLSPDLTDFWAAIAPAGDRIACDDFDENIWAKLLREASDQTFVRAVERLAPDARRFRAEYAHNSPDGRSKGKKTKKGAIT